MSLPAGTRLGPYEVVSSLGAGGMGEVYRARDARLGREVAIKILPARLSSDPASVARFEQEARAVAALTHPNILAIHDVGSHDGSTYAVTELLDGKTLRDTGRLPLRKAIEYALQVAQGLAAAHAKGITHRDIKPENLFVTTDGHVKVLDFGLAKMEPVLAGDATMATRVATDAGTVLGTVGYLSPEQAQGKPADPRSDIFSFGAVLYELITGTRAFKGDSSIDTLHQVVHGDPPAIDELRPDVPTELGWILAKCLAKDPDERYQSARDLVVDLRGLLKRLDSSPRLSAMTPAPVAAGETKRRSLVPTVIVAVVVVVLAALAWWRHSNGTPATGGAAGQATVERITSLNTVIDAAISPDGKYMAYVVSDNGLQSLWLRQLATSSTLQLVAPAVVGYWGIGFTPDGSAIDYTVYTADHPERTSFRVPVIGGVPKQLFYGADSQPVGSPDGKRLAWVRGEFPEPGSSALMVSDADGSNVRTLAVRRAPEFFYPIFFTAPAWSPDGQTLLVAMIRRTDRVVGTLLAVRASDGSPVDFPHYEWQGIGQPSYLPDGSGVLVIGNVTSTRAQIWWVDPRRESKRMVTSDLFDYRKVSLTADGSTLVTVAADSAAAIWAAPLEGSGNARRVSTGRYDGVSGVAAASDGRILYRGVDGREGNVWIMDADGTHPRQLSSDAVAAWPVATPDGRSVLYSRESASLALMDLDGRNTRELPGTTGAEHATFSPDGRWIFFTKFDTGIDQLWKMPATGGAPVRVLDGEASRPSVSPDGTQVAFYYRPQRSSNVVLAVMPIDGASPTRTFDVSPSTFYATVRWTADGKGLLHNSQRGDRANVWLQPLAGGPSRQLTRFADQNVFTFDLSQDGKTLLVARGLLTRDAMLVKNFR